MTRGQEIRAGKAYVELGTSDKLTKGLKNAQRKLRAFADGATRLGRSLIGVGAAVATPLAISAKTFSSFEQRMARVKALIVGITEEGFQKLEMEAQRLGETTAFSANQAAEAMGVFAQAGYDVDKILSAIGPTLDLAAAGQLGIAEAADIAMKVMAGMGLETSDLARAVDVLTRAMTTANTDLTQLGDAMKFAGGLAKTAGIEFEEVVAAIQLLSNAGIQAEMAGTTIRGVLLAVASPSEQASKKLEELRVAITDSEGNVRSLADIINDLNFAMAGMGTGERLDVLGQIFPARQAAGIAQLLAQGGDKLREYTAALRDSTGAAATIAGIQLNTLAGDVTILKSALEGLQITVGRILGPLLRVIVKHVTSAVAATSAWLKKNRELVGVLAIIAPTLAGLGVTLIAIGTAANVAAFVIVGLAHAWTAIQLAASLAGAAMSFALSPIGLVAGTIVAITAAMLAFTDAGNKVLRDIGQVFSYIAQTIKETLGAAINAVLAGDLEAAVEILVVQIKRFFKDLKRSILSTWYSTLTALGLMDWDDAIAKIDPIHKQITALDVQFQTLRDKFAKRPEKKIFEHPWITALREGIADTKKELDELGSDLVKRFRTMWRKGSLLPDPNKLKQELRYTTAGTFSANVEMFAGASNVPQNIAAIRNWTQQTSQLLAQIARHQRAAPTLTFQ